jgi:hypothetical protein
MPPPDSQKRRIVIAAGLVAAAAIATAFVLLRRHDGPGLSPHESSPGMYTYDAEGYRFEYHAPTGREGLYELRSDPNCLSSVLKQHEDVAKRCRAALAQDLNVERLEELRAKYADEIRRLEALGYL